LCVALRTLAEVEGAGGEGIKRAEEGYRQALSIFEELGNEVEMARTCESFASFLERTAQSNASRDEAVRLRERALEVQSRQLASETYALPPLEGEATQPGARGPS
jgi:hypothetical protein